MALNKEMLDNGHYINGSFNDYYIPRKSAYRQFDFNHDYLLLGYDDERGVFHSVGYLDNDWEIRRFLTSLMRITWKV